MRDIINKHQADILAALDITVDATHTDIMVKTGVFHSAHEKSMNDLRERELVAWTKKGSKSTLRFSITMAGIRALADHIEHQQKLLTDPSTALPARINVMDANYPAYKPKPMVPCRNNGHRDYRSLGAFA